MSPKIADLLQRLSCRSTIFCVLFFAAGNVMHYFHRLDANYITFMGVLLGYVVGHSIGTNLTQKNGNGDR